MTTSSIQARVHEIARQLPAAQRRIAALAVEDPEAVAFGTVQSVAQRSDTSAPTVVRFAAALGFDGYTALRDAIRAELSDRLRSAAARLEQPPDAPLLARTLEAERVNVEGTFADLDEQSVDTAVRLLSDDERRVWVMPSSQLSGVGRRFVDELSLVRSGVHLVDGPDFRIHTILAATQPGDLLVTFDIQRHESWLVRAQRATVARGAVPLVVTDRLPCSLDPKGGLVLTFCCETAGPFESQVGAVIISNLLVTGVVDLDRASLARRMKVLEDVWAQDDQFGS
jgi:DNA-binding MurR/RpiR family transcriptional regulator